MGGGLSGVIPNDDLEGLEPLELYEEEAPENVRVCACMAVWVYVQVCRVRVYVYVWGRRWCGRLCFLCIPPFTRTRVNAHTHTQERSRHLAREEELAEEYERQADLMFSAKNDKLSQATKSRAKRRGRN